jgi:hypothetical protein
MKTMLTALLLAGLLGAQETATELSGTALINHHLKAKWDEAGLTPSKRSDDAEFLRRASLDISGVIPSGDEAEAFLSDKSADKRKKLVDALLKDPRYAAHWADVWTGIIVGYDNDNRDQATRLRATENLKEMLAKNLPHDEFARRIVTVTGNYVEGAGLMMRGNEKSEDAKIEQNGLAGYLYNLQREAGRDFPLALAGKMSRAFLGIQIQCAQCHDHPFDKWTQEEFYGMASFFTEVRARRALLPSAQGKERKDVTQRDQYTIIEDVIRPAMAARPARPGAPNRPMAGGGDLSIPDSKSGPIKASFLENHKGAVAGEARRVTFARYLTEKENLQFAKMTVNRMWAHFFGAGIVNPVDDFNTKNKPTHPELLDGLAKDFIAHGYDNHWLIRAIAGSDAYQQTSRLAGKERDLAAEKYFAVARTRALSPEQIVRSFIEATDADGAEANRVAQGRVRPGAGGRPMAEGRMAREAQMFQMLSQFRSNFGDDEGSEVTDFAGTIPSALLMMNSQYTAAETTAQRTSALALLLTKHATPDARIRAIFLSTLTRAPSDKELSRWRSHAAKQQNAPTAYEDLLWTLLNTSEFLFNH